MSRECQHVKHVISFGLEQVIHIGHGYNIVEYNVLYRGHE